MNSAHRCFDSLIEIFEWIFQRLIYPLFQPIKLKNNWTSISILYCRLAEQRPNRHDLDFILSSRRTAAQPARQLASLNRAQQQKAFAWIKVISSTNAELAFQLANHFPRAMQAMDDEGINAWVGKAMDIFDISGLHPAITHLKNIENFSRERTALLVGLSFEDIGGILSNFVSGLSGRHLKIEAGEKTYTDTDRIYVPEIISSFATTQENFDLYKSIVVYLWAQSWYDLAF